MRRRWRPVVAVRRTAMPSAVVPCRRGWYWPVMARSAVRRPRPAVCLCDHRHRQQYRNRAVHCHPGLCAGGGCPGADRGSFARCHRRAGVSGAAQRAGRCRPLRLQRWCRHAATGLVLSASGEVSGIPTAAGSYEFSLQVADANGFTTTQAFTQVVDAGSQLIQAFVATPEAPVFAPGGTFALSASGGARAIRWCLPASPRPSARCRAAR
jgi:hypothetical protein